MGADVLNIIFALTSLVLGGMTLRALIFLPRVHRLPPLSTRPDRQPRVTVVLAARDEESRVEQTLRHLLALQHIDLQIVCVDDRSNDRTGAIMKTLSAEDSRVCPKRVDSLPAGWLGKCHACQVGAASATGDWILFTDADCWMKPDVLARALAVAERESVEHVTLTPGVNPRTIPARAWHIAFLITLSDWIARANRDKPGSHIGMGAFNLLKADFYRSFGGHQKLRMTVVDDIKLGKLVRAAGGRTRAFIGGDDVECHWGFTAREMVKIMEKNYFAAVNYRTAPALLIGTLMPLMWLIGLLGIVRGTPMGWLAAASLFSCIIPAMIISARLGWTSTGAWFTPFIFPLLYYAVLNSTVVTLRQGGIRWRDTFYPLKELRAGNLN